MPPLYANVAAVAGVAAAAAEREGGCGGVAAAAGGEKLPAWLKNNASRARAGNIVKCARVWRRGGAR